jgi:hypothetical protein
MGTYLLSNHFAERRGYGRIILKWILEKYVEGKGAECN